MIDRIAGGLGLALRSGAAPLLLGLRWADRVAARERRGAPLSRQRLAMATKIALDEFFFATELASAPFISLRDRARVNRETLRALDLFAKRGWLDEPERYHVRPPPLDVGRFEERQRTGLAYRHLRFQSGYAPHRGEPGRERWLRYRGNLTAHAWLLRHPGGPRPWLVCVPGYRMGQPVVDFAGFRVRWLHRTLGLNVAVPVMPLHGPRRHGRRSGDGFFAGDFVDTVHAQAQAVWDVRRLIRWLRLQGAPGVGAYGVSLGGYTVALLAGLEDEIDCVIAGIPASDFVRLMRAHAPELLLRAAERAGFSFERVARLLRVVSPLAIAPRPPRERRFLYAGLADRLASPDHARELWHHWERPRAVWYRGSHVSFLWEEKVEALLIEALAASGLLPRVPSGRDDRRRRSSRPDW